MIFNNASKGKLIFNNDIVNPINLAIPDHFLPSVNREDIYMKQNGGIKCRVLVISFLESKVHTDYKFDFYGEIYPRC